MTNSTIAKHAGFIDDARRNPGRSRTVLPEAAIAIGWQNCHLRLQRPTVRRKASGACLLARGRERVVLSSGTRGQRFVRVRFRSLNDLLVSGDNGHVDSFSLVHL
jgi:hypothetical protein